MSMSNVTVRKLDLHGNETYRYEGRLLARTPTSVRLEAIFTRYDRLDLGYTVFERGDRFVETYYADRWYNVFEVHAAGTDALRGWYCNITRPARIEAGQVSAVDLALDVWVNPDGSTRMLDEDEFAALPLSAEDAAAARAALREVRALASRRAGPFAPAGNQKPGFG
jgi:predicted RNA-binding protein associated with RNAse of E/G family